jgi:hypothetical protein
VKINGLAHITATKKQPTEARIRKEAEAIDIELLISNLDNIVQIA